MGERGKQPKAGGLLGQLTQEDNLYGLLGQMSPNVQSPYHLISAEVSGNAGSNDLLREPSLPGFSSEIW